MVVGAACTRRSAVTIRRAPLNLNTSFRRFSSLGIQASHRPLLECFDEIAVLLIEGTYVYLVKSMAYAFQLRTHLALADGLS